MPLFTTTELLESLEPLLCQPFLEGLPEVTGISIDTRTLQPGDLFIALQGQHTHGQTYLSQAFSQGASAALVQAPPSVHGSQCVEVTDVEHALRALARKARLRAPDLRTVAVTGSVGKTGTKEILRHVLSALGQTHGSVASFNNHLGVPLSLARMPRETRFGIFEAGMNHPGELTALSNLIQPHIALITKIGQAHLDNFRSLTDIAHAKAEIFKGVVPGGSAVLNHDDPFFSLLRSQAQNAGISRIITYGSQETSDIRLLDKKDTVNGSWIKVAYEDESFEGRIRYPGTHWISNVLGVLAVLIALGEDPKSTLPSFETLPDLPGRGQKRSGLLKGKKITIFDETYNANPTSVTAALRLLGQQSGKRRVAILGDMLELGTDTDILHQALRETIDAAGIDLVLTCGPHMKSLDRVLPSQKRGGWTPTVEELIPTLSRILQEGDMITIKGSRGIHLERAVTFLTKPQGS